MKACLAQSKSLVSDFALDTAEAVLRRIPATSGSTPLGDAFLLLKFCGRRLDLSLAGLSNLA
jgi:hypothetical protein